MVGTCCDTYAINCKPTVEQVSLIAQKPVHTCKELTQMLSWVKTRFTDNVLSQRLLI